MWITSKRTFGCSAVNARMTEGSTPESPVRTEPITSVPALTRGRLLCRLDRPVELVERPRRGESSSAWPAGVSSTWRLVRTNSSTFSPRSSARTCWLSAGWLMCNCFAARLKCSSCATTRNVRNRRVSTSISQKLMEQAGTRIAIEPMNAFGAPPGSKP